MSIARDDATAVIDGGTYAELFFVGHAGVGPRPILLFTITSKSLHLNFSGDPHTRALDKLYPKKRL